MAISGPRRRLPRNGAGPLAVLALALGLTACTPGRTTSPRRAGVPDEEVARIVPATTPAQCGATRVSSALGRRILNEVRLLGGDGLLSTGVCSHGQVDVQLRPGDEDLARRLRRTYGDAIVLSVGLNRYSGAPVHSPRCSSLPPADRLPPGLRLRLRLSPHAVRTGGNFGGEVIITEDGNASFSIDTGQPLTAYVLRRGTRRVIGVYAGAIGGTGFITRLRRGESHSVRIEGGTARCDGGVGSSLPPGRYDVVVLVFSESPRPGPLYATRPVALSVVKESDR